MNIFAIELSSRQGSVALLENGVVTAEKSWTENFKNRQQLFDSIAELNVDWETVDLFAVGRGPGAFSGMRISLSIAQALAAPSKKPIYTLNSGTSLAAQVDESNVAIVGDARRNKVWAGIFDGTELTKEFELLELDKLADFIPAGTLVISPDQDRLEEQLSDFNTFASDEPLVPTAAKLGELVFERHQNGIPSESLEPLYMHPPVFIEPRFPA